MNESVVVPYSKFPEDRSHSQAQFNDGVLFELRVAVRVFFVEAAQLQRLLRPQSRSAAASRATGASLSRRESLPRRRNHEQQPGTSRSGTDALPLVPQAIENSIRRMQITQLLPMLLPIRIKDSADCGTSERE
jgi:hypothetical protein